MVETNEELARQLRQAIVSGDRAEFERQLAAGVSLEGLPRIGRPLLVAASRGRLAMLERLLELDVDLDSGGGSAALTEAAYHGHLEIVWQLLAAGVSTEPSTPGAITALHRAARRGHTEIVSLLIDAKADVNARTKSGETPLHHAVLAPGGDKLVDLLLEAGAEIDAADNRGRTPLHVTGHTPALAALLLRGANSSLTDRNGELPAQQHSRSKQRQTLFKLAAEGSPAAHEAIRILVARYHALNTAPPSSRHIERLITFSASDQRISELSYDPTGERLLSVDSGERSRVRVWQAQTGQLIGELPFSAVRGVLVFAWFTENGRQIVVFSLIKCMGDSEKSYCLFDSETLAPIAAPSKELSRPKRVASNGSLDLETAYDGSLVRRTAGNTLARFGNGYCCALHPLAAEFALGASDGSIGIYRARTPNKRAFPNHAELLESGRMAREIGIRVEPGSPILVARGRVWADPNRGDYVVITLDPFDIVYIAAVRLGEEPSMFEILDRLYSVRRGRWDPWRLAWTDDAGPLVVWTVEGKPLWRSHGKNLVGAEQSIESTELAAVEAFVSADWIEQGVRIRRINGDTLVLSSVQNMSVEHDWGYDGLSLSWDTSWCRSLARAVAEKLQLPWEDRT